MKFDLKHNFRTDVLLIFSMHGVLQLQGVEFNDINNIFSDFDLFYWG